MSLLRMDRASFRYAGSAEPALSELSLGVEPGELIALFGRPGAGTSTLLLVAGGYAPRVVGGELAGELVSLVRQPAVVFATPWTQLTGLCQTVFAEVAFGPASHGLQRERIREVVSSALGRLNVSHLAMRDPTTLSGGELQRVIVASALALEPDLLLLDDPAAELDPGAADALYEMLKELAGTGVAILVATPDTERASRVASRVIVLESGRVAYDGVATGVPA